MDFETYSVLCASINRLAHSGAISQSEWRTLHRRLDKQVNFVR